MTPEGVTFARLDADAAQDRFQRLRAPLGVSSFGINLIVLEAGQRGRVHRHEAQEEVYLVLAGTGTMTIDGEVVDLKPGRYVFVAAASVRKPVAGPSGLSWVVVGAPPQDGWEPQL